MYLKNSLSLLIVKKNKKKTKEKNIEKREKKKEIEKSRLSPIILSRIQNGCPTQLCRNFQGVVIDKGHKLYESSIRL